MSNASFKSRKLQPKIAFLVFELAHFSRFLLRCGDTGIVLEDAASVRHGGREIEREAMEKLPSFRRGEWESFPAKIKAGSVRNTSRLNVLSLGGRTKW